MDIHLLERLKDIVRSAGTTVRSAQDAAMGIREKSSHVDLVTLYDPMVQEFLRSRLMTLLPEAGFLGEEDATHDIAGRRQLFIVDPIDGTMNFIRGLHHSSISVALAVDGVVTHAVVYNPYYDEMFSAQRGKGAWLNGQRLHVTQHAVHDSLVLFGSAIYYRETIPETLRFVEALLPNCLDFRRGGSAALDCCYVAVGRADLFFECKLCPWDYAAGGLIVTEAVKKKRILLPSKAHSALTSCISSPWAWIFWMQTLWALASLARFSATTRSSWALALRSTFRRGATTSFCRMR